MAMEFWNTKYDGCSELGNPSLGTRALGVGIRPISPWPRKLICFRPAAEGPGNYSASPNHATDDDSERELGPRDLVGIKVGGGD